MPPVVTFTSDFGLTDWFVGVVHGVIHELCPEARVVDLSHDVSPGDVAHAAFLLEAATPDFPSGAVHLAVVDPGVGTARRALAVSARGQLFVGPDNGVLDWALGDPKARAHELTDERYFRRPVSRTFHGRDVFAPVAAHLALGIVIEKLGPRVAQPVRLNRPRPEVRNGRLEGRVAYVDRFGNALTDLSAEALSSCFPGVDERDVVVEVAGRDLPGIARSYGDHRIGVLVAILGSSGRLEIAEVRGDASARFGICVGDSVTVRKA